MARTKTPAAAPSLGDHRPGGGKRRKSRSRLKERAPERCMDAWAAMRKGRISPEISRIIDECREMGYGVRERPPRDPNAPDKPRKKLTPEEKAERKRQRIEHGIAQIASYKSRLPRPYVREDHPSDRPPASSETFGLCKARQLSGYEDSDLSRFAVEFRKAEKIKKEGNVAVFVYSHNGSEYIAATHTVGAKGLHSEELAELVMPKGAKLLRLFTERQPCGLPGHVCDRLLANRHKGAHVTFLAEFDDDASRLRGNEQLKTLMKGQGL